MVLEHLLEMEDTVTFRTEALMVWMVCAHLFNLPMYYLKVYICRQVSYADDACYLFAHYYYMMM